MAGGAKVLFEVIVGARQVFDLVVLEESVPITLGDFAEVCYSRSERPQPVLLLFHGLQQLLIRLLERAHIALLSVSEQMSGLMHPRIGLPDGRPELLCRRQSGSHEKFQSAEFVGEPLFSATRLMESEMACSRSSN